MKTLLMVLLMGAEAAWACVGQPCRDPWSAAVRNGAQVPSNVPALVLSSPLVSRPLTTREGIELQRADGGQLEVEVNTELGGRHVLVRPREALPVGETLHLRYPMLCDGGVGAPMYDADFTVGEATPLPTSLGTLAVKETASGSLFVWEASTCGSTVEAGWARLAFNPSLEMRPYLPLTRWSLFVDGAEWATTPIGVILPDGGLGGEMETQLLLPHVVCGGGRYTALTEGHHLAQLKGFIVGVKEPLFLTTDITLSCGTDDGGVVDSGAPSPHGCNAVPGMMMMAWLALVLAAGLSRRKRTSCT